MGGAKNSTGECERKERGSAPKQQDPGIAIYHDGGRGGRKGGLINTPLYSTSMKLEGLGGAARQRKRNESMRKKRLLKG